MNKKFLTYLVAGTAMVGFASCKKNNLSVDTDGPTPPEAARFLTTSVTNSYYIQDLAEGSFFKIPFGITTASNVDRNIQFTYISPSGAANGTQYNAPTTLTIPAGKSIDTLSIQGLFAGYPTGRKDTVKIKIAGGDNFIKPIGYSDSIVLIMQKYCNVILDELKGEFKDTRETNSSGGSPYGPYISTVEITPVSSTTADVVFTNFWDSKFNATGTIDWEDPANFKVTIPLQETGLDYDVGQPILLQTSPGQVSTFSSCDQSYSLTVDFIVDNYPTAGSQAYYSQNYKIYIKR